MKKIMLSAFRISDKEKITGIQRVTREVILRIDKMIENTNIQVEYLCHDDAKHNIIKLEELKNIRGELDEDNIINLDPCVITEKTLFDLFEN